MNNKQSGSKYKREKVIRDDYAQENYRIVVKMIKACWIETGFFWKLYYMFFYADNIWFCKFCDGALAHAMRFSFAPVLSYCANW